ncbi:CLUMA_CG006792, isoform A [Clunio marinus]|uniref:CLUMA_CG006792, isoform A n=1 Tax=Clunio marinus TaxID=568069 RepID=A0A1J1I4D9_9DIPT|nr:CLUMA_CG006792, isoform A [Clunio marinus]
MALVNYSLPFGAVNTPTTSWATLSPIHASPHAVNDLYEPAGNHQENVLHNEHYYKNGPYRHHQQQQQQQQQQQNSRGYLPPHQAQSNSRNGYSQTTRTRTYGESSYSQQQSQTSFSNLQKTTSGFYNGQSFKDNPYQQQQQQQQQKQPQPQTTKAPFQSNSKNYNLNQAAGYPERPPGYKPIQAGQGSRTQNVAVLDYDDDEGEGDEYYDDHTAAGKGDSQNRLMPVTPIQGPIFLKNNSVPVVPLYSYPKVYNGTFMQIPIWWTALSVALGLNVRGDVIKGVPCVKRYHQLFCPTAGNSYPIDRIENFIDENKALMKRMYGYFEAENEYGSTFQQGKKRKRMLYGADANPPNLPDLDEIYFPPGEGPNPVRDAGPTGDSYFSKLRNKRQTRTSSSSSSNSSNRSNAGSGKSDTGRVDACESKVEIVTPYWASSSAGKIRAIVNTQHFEQAIHQEVCSKVQTNRCAGECGCEQKYKWHRLLAYDPDNDCKGIFMDWFLFPSCCVCRCNPL